MVFLCLFYAHVFLEKIVWKWSECCSLAKRKYSVGCDILVVVIMKSTVFSVVMPCSSELSRRFGRTCFRLQGRRVSQRNKPVETGSKLSESRMEDPGVIRADPRPKGTVPVEEWLISSRLSCNPTTWIGRIATVMKTSHLLFEGKTEASPAHLWRDWASENCSFQGKDPALGQSGLSGHPCSYSSVALSVIAYTRTLLVLPRPPSPSYPYKATFLDISQFHLHSVKNDPCRYEPRYRFLCSQSLAFPHSPLIE
jgi:hypothetical protein